MRIHEFKFWGGSRWIDLDHVQEISNAKFTAIGPGSAPDKDGILVPYKSHGQLTFTYRLAFQGEESEIAINITADRYIPPPREDDGLKILLHFKSEYDRFFKAWVERKESRGSI